MSSWINVCFICLFGQKVENDAPIHSLSPSDQRMLIRHDNSMTYQSKSYHMDHT